MGCIYYFNVVVKHHDQKQLKENVYFGLHFQMTRVHHGDDEEDMEKAHISLAHQETETATWKLAGATNSQPLPTIIYFPQQDSYGESSVNFPLCSAVREFPIQPMTKTMREEIDLKGRL